MTVFDKRLALSEKVILKYLSARLNTLEGEDKNALQSEFKEWLKADKHFQEKIWAIPDLTNSRLRSFFLRAITNNK